jgi:hypothetical protein
MRRRVDTYFTAGWKRAYALGNLPDAAPSVIENPIPAAEPGDVWIIRADPNDWKTQTWADQHEDWPIVGYALTCPNERCRFGTHEWTHASNCNLKITSEVIGSQPRCQHEAEHRSCWEWTGTIEEGTLTATPSLLSPEASGGCGWHGFLRNGEMVPA